MEKALSFYIRVWVGGSALLEGSVGPYINSRLDKTHPVAHGYEKSLYLGKRGPTCHNVLESVVIDQFWMVGTSSHEPQHRQGFLLVKN
jgi:hypothetical protein